MGEAACCRHSRGQSAVVVLRRPERQRAHPPAPRCGRGEQTGVKAAGQRQQDARVVVGFGGELAEHLLEAVEVGGAAQRRRRQATHVPVPDHRDVAAGVDLEVRAVRQATHAGEERLAAERLPEAQQLADGLPVESRPEGRVLKERLRLAGDADVASGDGGIQREDAAGIDTGERQARRGVVNDERKGPLEAIEQPPAPPPVRGERHRRRRDRIAQVELAPETGAVEEIPGECAQHLTRVWREAVATVRLLARGQAHPLRVPADADPDRTELGDVADVPDDVIDPGKSRSTGRGARRVAGEDRDEAAHWSRPSNALSRPAARRQSASRTPRSSVMRAASCTVLRQCPAHRFAQRPGGGGGVHRRIREVVAEHLMVGDHERTPDRHRLVPSREQGGRPRGEHHDRGRTGELSPVVVIAQEPGGGQVGRPAAEIAARRAGDGEAHVRQPLGDRGKDPQRLVLRVRGHHGDETGLHAGVQPGRRRRRRVGKHEGSCAPGPDLRRQLVVGDDDGGGGPQPRQLHGPEQAPLAREEGHGVHVHDDGGSVTASPRPCQHHQRRRRIHDPQLAHAGAAQCLRRAQRLPGVLDGRRPRPLRPRGGHEPCVQPELGRQRLGAAGERRPRQEEAAPAVVVGRRCHADHGPAAFCRSLS